jgi:lysine biosynthesis protein LysW
LTGVNDRAWTSSEQGCQAKRDRAMSKTRCPNCDSLIRSNEPREGAVIVCPYCGVELEVIRADPFAVDFTDDWQEDWEGE